MRKQLKTAVVLGSAKQGLGEFWSVVNSTEPDEIFAVNDMIHFCPRPCVAVTLHPEHFFTWRSKRLANGYERPKAVVIHSAWREWFQICGREPKLFFEPDLVTPQYFAGQTDSGSSGLFAVKVALKDYGFDRVILCGIPMDADACHYNRISPWRAADRHRKGWEQARRHLVGKVRSMSGWTRDFLGDAREWL